MLFNKIMSKIRKFASKNNIKKIAQLKSYLGFEYIKLKKDVNGLEFNIEHLLEYANENRYNISVARKVDNATFVYNYFVEGSKLNLFFDAFFNGKIEGEIIDIDKLKPENLA